jgi:hypothetical protein
MICRRTARAACRSGDVFRALTHDREIRNADEENLIDCLRQMQAK